MHREEDRVRINGRLVDGRNGFTVWADRFAGPETDLPEIHDAMARRADTQSSGRMRCSESG